MFVDLTRQEREVLKMIAGEPMPHIAAGAGLWEHVAYLRNIGLLQRQHTEAGTAYVLSRQGKTYLRRHP